MTTAPAHDVAAMPAGRLAGRVLATVDSRATLREIAQELAAQEVGVVLVRGEHGLVGLVSERDVVAALADFADPDGTQAHEMMTGDLVLVDDDATLVEVGRLMVDAGIRHIVIGDGGPRSGILSIRDVLAVLVGPNGSFPTTGPVRS